jgi:5'-3' exonuclease
MGVKDFTKVFKPVRTVTFKDIKDYDVAVDAFIELFRSASMQYAAKLTNPAGEETLHLSVTLANAVKRCVLGCDDIWVFDSRDPRAADDTKQATLAARADVRANNTAAADKLAAEITKLDVLAARMPRAQLLKIDAAFDATLSAKREQLAILKSRTMDAPHFSGMIRDVQYVLRCLGVRVAVAPAGVDAEMLAAQLTRENIVDGVISTDTDTIPYGATRLYKKCRGPGGKYDEYVLAECLKQHAVTYAELVTLCTALGTDFCQKSPGVGPATVVKKFRTLEYTDEQKKAQAKFMNFKKVKYEFIASNRTTASLDELKTWLTVKQGFNRERLDKMLAPLYV